MEGAAGAGGDCRSARAGAGYCRFLRGVAVRAMIETNLASVAIVFQDRTAMSMVKFVFRGQNGGPFWHLVQMCINVDDCFVLICVIYTIFTIMRH